MWIDALAVITLIIGGFRAVRATRLLPAVLWLAVTSAMTATLLYRAGAPQAGAIELSVGAGLVTILFVFSIATSGEDAMTSRALVPPLLAWLLITTAALFLSWSILSAGNGQTAVAATEVPFAIVMWEERSLDVLVQIGLIFSGVMGILGLLTEEKVKVKQANKADTAAPTIQWTNLQTTLPGKVMNNPVDSEFDRPPVREKELA